LAPFLAKKRKPYISASRGGRHYMAIEVRDASGPVMQAKFTFEVEKLKHAL
jgi:hypothetical protein